MEAKTFKKVINGQEITVEIGKLAMQSDGSCVIKCGETVVMVNTCVADKPRDGVDFLPLSVEFEEKMYAVGKIPGSFKRREGRASDKAILVSRLIDRPLRPLFPKHFYNDITIVATALSVDPDVNPAFLAMLGSSISLMISTAPFDGPTGAVNVGLIDGKFIANPNLSDRKKSLLDLTVSGTENAILMVEAGAQFISEQQMLEAICFTHENIKEQVAFQKEIIKEFIKPKLSIKEPSQEEVDRDNKIEEFFIPQMPHILDTFDRQERHLRSKEAKEKAYETFLAEYGEEVDVNIEAVFYSLSKKLVRANIIEKEQRLDGRKLDEIRPIWCEVGLLPRVHGSGVFTRGQTQVLTTCTLGMLSDAQTLEGLDDEVTKRYIHHYNMPPYSTGEAKMMRGTGRREIGHGNLAERALYPVLPSEQEFPYTIRTVSEVLSSNGSTSQASVCGSTLALMDAGVPISSPVAGCAMGLIQDEKTGKIFILTDIQGEEDYYGDMDFKVAGTENGITAIQMDIKIHGINKEILQNALEKARVGRLFIMNKMLETINAPRENISKYAPKIVTFSINKDKIGEVIGGSGKVINKIIEETNVKIDISDEGIVSVAGYDQEKINRAKYIIEIIANGINEGAHFEGVVTSILQFGAFVELVPSKEGMIHISKLSDSRVEKVTDIVKIGDKVEVEVIKVDNRDRIDLKLIKKL